MIDKKAHRGMLRVQLIGRCLTDSAHHAKGTDSSEGEGTIGLFDRREHHGSLSLFVIENYLFVIENYGREKSALA
jgi:hypothetical protein